MTHLCDVDDGPCDASAVLPFVQPVLDAGDVAKGEHANTSGRLADVELSHHSANEPQHFGEVRSPDAPGSVD